MLVVSSERSRIYVLVVSSERVTYIRVSGIAFVSFWILENFNAYIESKLLIILMTFIDASTTFYWIFDTAIFNRNLYDM